MVDSLVENIIIIKQKILDSAEVVYHIIKDLGK